jgi:hypothetical protein
MLNEDKMRRTLLHVLALTVNGQYEALEELTAGKRLSANLIKQSIEEWPEKACPHHFIMPPSESLTHLVMEGGLEPIPAVEPQEWMVELYLWTIEQGRSDLNIRLTVIDADSDYYQVELDDILVM